jgi:hypothetical protein
MPKSLIKTVEQKNINEFNRTRISKDRRFINIKVLFDSNTSLTSKYIS